MTNTEHYLEVAKECGASTLQEHWQLYPSRISFGHEELSAYTTRILAEKDAEIERLNSALCGCEDTWRERLSIANAAIAIKDEALKDIATYPHKTDEVLRWANEAISTTPESIAAWEAEKQKLSVTNILLRVSPDENGNGVEEYATCVADVERELSRLSCLVMDYELGIKKAPAVKAGKLSEAKVRAMAFEAAAAKCDELDGLTYTDNAHTIHVYKTKECAAELRKLAAAELHAANKKEGE